MRYILVILLVISLSFLAYADELIKEFSGSGAHTTRPFTVPDGWEIQWDAKGDIFQLYLFNADGSMAGLPANQMGAGKGSAYQPKGGSYYLTMNAMDSWTVKIIDVE